MREAFVAGRVTMRTRELVAAGMTRSQIAWAVGVGRLIRIRIGHYCLPGLDEPTTQAVRIGGRLACVSELQRLGVWVTHPPEVPHVHLAENASRLRGPGSPVRRLREGECVAHWGELDEASMDARVTVHDALRQTMGCLGELDAAASVESAVRLGLVTVDELRRGASVREESVLSRVDGRADSGLETLVREPLRDARLRVEPQHHFRGLGQLDLLVGGFVAVELDGRRFHSGVVAPRDRRRDAVVASHGLTPLRFDYAQVVYDLPSVIRAIAGAVVAHRNVRGSGRRRALRLLRASTARIS